MTKRFSLSIAIAVCFGALFSFADEPKIETYEKRTPTGVIQERYQYYLKDGKQVEHGLSSIHYSNGQVLTSSTYQHGKRHGPEKSYFKWINKLSYEGQYVGGRKHGTTRYWSPQGKLLFESQWTNGKPISGLVWNGALSSGLHQTIRTIEYKDGAAIAGSEKSFTVDYQRPPETDGLPDFDQFLRWDHCMYDYGSTYTYLNKLPTHTKIPDVLAVFIDGDHNRIDSQLEMLTRVRPEFGLPVNEAHAIWQKWWDQVGRHQLERLETTEPDEESWKIACQGRDLPLPKLAVILPDEYELHFTFRGGDYGGVCKEKMVLKRTKESASLERVFSTKTRGPSKTEHWVGLTCEDADKVVRAIGHVIDNPWLMNDEVQIQKDYLEAKRQREQEKAEKAKLKEGEWPKPFRKSPKLRNLSGRESFSTYYSSADYELRDSKSNLWWNANPTHWHGLNEDRFNWTTPRQGVGPVYKFFISQYPESKKSDGESVGWKETTP